MENTRRYGRLNTSSNLVGPKKKGLCNMSIGWYIFCGLFGATLGQLYMQANMHWIGLVAGIIVIPLYTLKRSNEMYSQQMSRGCNSNTCC